MFYRPACWRSPDLTGSSLLAPSLRLSCVCISIPWPSLGDLAPPVSSRCPTWRSRGADLSPSLFLFLWFQRRSSRKVSSPFFACLARACGCLAVSLLPRLKPGERRCRGRSYGAFARRDARKLRRESQHHFLRGAVDFMRCCCFQRCFFGVLSWVTG